MYFRVVMCVTMLAIAAAVRVPMKGILLKNLSVVDDIGQFQQEHPGLKLTPIEKKVFSDADTEVRYMVGLREDGDRLVGQKADVFSNEQTQDYTLQLTYPEEGLGSVLSYVEINCIQDNYDGNAYIVAGGIGQRFISIVVEAKNTYTFSYRAEYYGMN